MKYIKPRRHNSNHANSHIATHATTPTFSEATDLVTTQVTKDVEIMLMKDSITHVILGYLFTFFMGQDPTFLRDEGTFWSFRKGHEKHQFGPKMSKTVPQTLENRIPLTTRRLSNTVPCHSTFLIDSSRPT